MPLLRRYVFHNENTRDLFLLPYPDFADVRQYYSYALLIKSSFIGSFYVTCQSIIDVNKAIDQNIHSRTRIDRVFFIVKSQWKRCKNVKEDSINIKSTWNLSVKNNTTNVAFRFSTNHGDLVKLHKSIYLSKG